MKIIALILLICLGPAVFADDVTDAKATAQKIDALFADSWQIENVTPSNQADDAEFYRRLSLDLSGRIPAVSEVRDFLAEQSPEKRTHVVEQFLNRPAFVKHLTIVMRNALIPQANEQPQFRTFIPGFDAWLWENLSQDTPYDQLVRNIITSDLSAESGAALAATTSPNAFFIVRELKPESLATGTSRAFLGVRLDCAQCHDHPFDQWSQEQFWNMAAFYSGFERDEDEDAPLAMMAMPVEKKDKHSIKIAGTDETADAIFLTGQQPDWKSEVSPRDALADWIVDAQNPWFAKMAVNRMWAQFFGRGLVDPVDDFSENNPASHPEVLQLLADDFVDHNYDLKHLIRVIVATKVYQLSSKQNHESQEDPIHFARAQLRGLTPEQFFDSLAEAVGFYQPFRSENPFVLENDTPRSRFLSLFRNEAESPLDRETTILQALAMMNGEFISDATDLSESRTLRAVTEFPGMTDIEKLETLFLSTLSRKPTSEERERLMPLVNSEDKANAMADIYWALLNSSEFLLNH